MTHAGAPEPSSLERLFGLGGRVVVITGGAGLLGEQHAQAVAAAGGIPVLIDRDEARASRIAERLRSSLAAEATVIAADITDEKAVERALSETLSLHGRVDALVNNAARNPAVEAGDLAWARLERFPLDQWHADIAVGLTGAFLCARVFGAEMARRGRGAIVNVASDLAVIAPDQRLYRRADAPEESQPVKPVSYSVVKTGLIGLTRYLATYWADRGVRVNAISPGGVYNGQPEEFVKRLSNLVPLGRMAAADEYRGAILFLCSDASSYMTGTNLVIDGGRSVW
jgi:NAD(P)-dependent dehydrogenase (short-subunit alcohol dehydrogenase family)